MGGEPFKAWRELLGEKRALSMYRCKSLWNTGAKQLGIEDTKGSIEAGKEGY